MTVKAITGWFAKAKPLPVSNKDFQVQLGVHMEEVSEMLQELFATDPSKEDQIVEAFNAINKLAVNLKNGDIEVETHDKEMLLDSLADQMVTAIGTGYMCGFDMVGALEEVNRSNNSKFDEDGMPIFLENGKIAKSDLYSPPDLTPFI